MKGGVLPGPLSPGEAAPQFRGLHGADGHRYSLGSFRDMPVLALVFVANGCPTVRYYEERLIALQHGYGSRGLQLVAINSNNPHLSPPDGYPEMVERATSKGWPFPYLKDEDGSLARACGAVCTPHAFVFDAERRLRYRGRIDDSRTGSRVTRHDLEAAVEELLEDKTVSIPETTPFGCSVVW